MSDNPEKMRLDSLLVDRKLVETRERAQRAIMAGNVFVRGQRVDKPGTRVRWDAVVTMTETEKYVGRGGVKLEAALAAFGIEAMGKVCVDVGASTGGFSDCLLQHGAARVHALDVGHGQLHWKIRQDARVVVQEGINCRHLGYADVGEWMDLAVVDVSFISLKLILEPVFGVLKDGGDVVVLIKPQFELLPSQVGKGGVVRDVEVRRGVVDTIREFVNAIGRQWCGFIESPIRGGSGNVEYLAHLRK